MTVSTQSDEDGHPIRAAHRKIEEAFVRARPDAQAELETGLLSCLLPIAEAVNWHGTSHQIAEAMPHETQVDDIATLRTVLLRIGIKTHRVDVLAHKLRKDYCPCLAVGNRGELVLIDSIEPDGVAVIFESLTAAWRRIKVSKLKGEIYTIRLVDEFAQNEELQREGFIWPLLKNSASQLKLVFWQSLAINLLALTMSFYVMQVYDKAIGTKSPDTLVLLFIGGLVAVGLEVSMRDKRGATIARLGARFDALAATGAYQSVLRLPLSMSENAPLGAQLTRFKQFEVGRELFGGSLATSLIDLPFTLIFFIMVFALGGSLGFIPVAFAVILAIVGLCSNPSLSKQMRDMGEWKGKSDSLLVEICTRINLIRADNSEHVWLNRATDTYKEYLTSRFKNQQFNNSLQVIAQAGVSISGTLVLALGSIEVMRGTLSLGSMIAVMAVVWRVLGPIQIVFLSLHRIRSLVGTIRQIDKLIKIKGEREPGRVGGAGFKVDGRMSLSGACFRYANRADLTIKGVSLEIAKGEFVTLVGASGAGKSTLLKLMLGLYQPQSGGVRLDGLDLRQIDTSELRSKLSFLGQDPAFFYGTLAQNMRMVAPDASDEELVTALALMGIRIDDANLPEGLQTRLTAKNKRSMSLSFLQRLAIARAFLRAAPIILLDEPSNHLDRDGDMALMNLISKFRGKCTIIMTTARPSHMNMADRVLVLNEGVLVAQGVPQEIVPVLLAQNLRAAG